MPTAPRSSSSEPTFTSAPPTATPQPSATTGPTAPSTGSGTGTELTIVYSDGRGATSTWRLTCDPDGGTHPQPEAACAALDRSGRTALPAVRKDRACAQTYGGPQSAMVTGTWRGEQVSSRFARNNSCETARWKALDGLLPGAQS